MAEHIARGATSSSAGLTASEGGDATAAVAGHLSPLRMLWTVLRIAIAGRGGQDPFAGLRLRLRDALPPLVLAVAIAVIGAAAEEGMPALQDPTAAQFADLMALHATINLARILVAAGVTYIVAQLFAPDRIRPGLIAYLWAHALLICPWLVLATQIIDASDPAPWLILASAGSLAPVVAGTTRVMRAVFDLPDLPSAIFISVAGAVLSGALMLLVP
jgi:hypothetical protein